MISPDSTATTTISSSSKPTKHSFSPQYLHPLPCPSSLLSSPLSEEHERIIHIIETNSFSSSRDDRIFLSDKLIQFSIIKQQVEWLQGDSNVADKLMQYLKVVRIPKNQTILSKGQRNDQVFFILSGEVSVWRAKTKQEIDCDKQLRDHRDRLQKLLDNEILISNEGGGVRSAIKGGMQGEHKGNQALETSNHNDNHSKITQLSKQLTQAKRQFQLLNKDSWRLENTPFLQEQQQLYQQQQQSSPVDSFILEYELSVILRESVDCIGYRDCLSGRRPIETVIAASNVVLLSITGEHLFNILTMDSSNLQFILSTLCSIFPTAKISLLEALAQTFNPFYYKANASVLTIGSSGNKPSQALLYIVRQGSLMVKHNDLSLCSLGEGALFGLEALQEVPRFEGDTQMQLTMRCDCSRLLLLGVDWNEIEQLSASHQDNTFMELLRHYAKLRMKYYMERYMELQVAMKTPADKENHRRSTSRTRNMKNSNMSHMNCTATNEETKGLSSVNDDNDCDQESNMRITLKKNGCSLRVAVQPDPNTSSHAVNLKAIVKNMLSFRPSKLQENQLQQQQATQIKLPNNCFSSSSSSPQAFQQQQQQQPQIKQQSVGSIATAVTPTATYTPINLYQSGATTTNSAGVAGIVHSLFRHQKLSLGGSISPLKKGRNLLPESNNRYSFKERLSSVVAIPDNNNNSNSNSPSKFRLQKSILFSPTPAASTITWNLNTEDDYEQFYSQKSLSDRSESSSELVKVNEFTTQRYPQQQSQPSQLSRISVVQQICCNSSNLTSPKKNSMLLKNKNNPIQGIAMTKQQSQESSPRLSCFKETKSVIRPSTPVGCLVSQKPGTQLKLSNNSQGFLSKRRSKIGITNPQRQLSSSASSSPPIRGIEQLSQSLLRSNNNKKNNNQCKIHPANSIHRIVESQPSSQTKTNKSTCYSKQTSSTAEEIQRAVQAKLEEDFELIDGKKLIQKRAPTFSQLREDFISSSNPYSQCQDLIEKLEMIADSNKAYTRNNNKEYERALTEKANAHKRLLKILQRTEKDDFLRTLPNNIAGQRGAFSSFLEEIINRQSTNCSNGDYSMNNKQGLAGSAHGQGSCSPRLDESEYDRVNYSGEHNIRCKSGSNTLQQQQNLKFNLSQALLKPQEGCAINQYMYFINPAKSTKHNNNHFLGNFSTNDSKDTIATLTANSFNSRSMKQFLLNNASSSSSSRKALRVKKNRSDFLNDHQPMILTRQISPSNADLIRPTSAAAISNISQGSPGSNIVRIASAISPFQQSLAVSQSLAVYAEPHSLYMSSFQPKLAAKYSARPSTAKNRLTVNSKSQTQCIGIKAGFLEKNQKKV